jgi:glutamyl-Q tRNA(Asp) synthetase
MSIKRVTRFAPSPTGRLHLGHAWSALQAHDLAQAVGGQFLLRIEDIDQSRCRAEFVRGIEEDLSWLGLNWTGEVLRQSERMIHYAAALDRLIERGLAYRCWCTRAEIAAASASAPQGEAATVYPGTCKGRADPGDGRPFCWRIDMTAATAQAGLLFWEEQGHGRIAVDPPSQGDVVIARKDVPTSYHLAVTIDDAAQGITDVVRGQDLFEATHVHRVLQALLGLPAPRYHHHALIAGSDGERLAKRKQSPTIASLRAAGHDPAQLISDMRAGRFPFGFAHLPA